MSIFEKKWDPWKVVILRKGQRFY